MPQPTIGVFDSGFGGLTVLRELLPLVPGGRFLYLGDTARLPYGAKSRETIARYALSSAAFLLAQGADMLVVACNTASALALDDLRRALPIPVIGVIDPGTRAAATSPDRRSICNPESGTAEPKDSASATIAVPSSSPKILVLATTATVQSAAYTRSCAALGLEAYEKACPLLVPLVEEGWIDHPVTAQVLKIYLSEALSEAPGVTTLILGCTHYPLLRPLIEQILAGLGHPLFVVDSASATARAATALLAPGNAQEPTTTIFYATDSIEKFQRLGSAFLGRELHQVELIDLGG